jgi:hypothetical protein
MLTASSVVLSAGNVSRIDDLNMRLRNLQQKAAETENELASMGGGGSVPSVLAVIPPSGKSSVDPPWERALTAAKVPYYVK